MEAKELNMGLSANVNEKANLIWAIADKLTGVYKPHEYGKVILPLTVIRRFDCILADTKEAVLEKHNSMAPNLPMREVFLKKLQAMSFITQANTPLKPYLMLLTA